MPKRTNPTVTQLRQQIYLRLRRSIEQGTFLPGERLPPSREHARVLGVSRNTVSWALERLQAEGYVVSRVGDGSYVADRVSLPRQTRSRAASATGAVHSPLSSRGRLIAESALRWKPPTDQPMAFRIGQPALQAFPFATWQKLERQVPVGLRMAQAHYQDPAGHPMLRQAIAQWLLVSRGIQCEGQQIIITSGSQQAIDLIGRLLLDVGDEVLVEDPGYPGIRYCLIGQGAVIRPVAVDGEGLCIAQGEASWPQARLAVVTPTHQFPVGVRMSLGRRLALIDWARRQGAWLIEDDYDGEFQYGEHRIPALCSMAHDSRVLYVGTFSKSLHPGLRLGFIVLPPMLVDAFASAKVLADRHAPGAVQEVLSRFIQEGYLLRHLRRMRELYRARQAALIESLSLSTAGVVTLQPSLQGMHLFFEAAPHVRDVALSEAASEVGVYLAPLSRYCIESPRRGWLLGYAGYDEATLVAAARSLGPVWSRSAESFKFS